MRALNVLILWLDEERKDKIAKDISLLSKNEIIGMRFDEEIDPDRKELSELDVLVIDLHQSKDKEEISAALTLAEKIKEINPDAITMLSGKYSASTKKKYKEIADVFSGVTAVKIKKDFRYCIDQIICKKIKLNHYLTDFFAPHLVGDLEKKGFELVLNDTYDRDLYKEHFLDLWQSFLFIAPLLKEESKDLLKMGLRAYEERNLTAKEKTALHSQFFFQFNSLYALHNFTERRLYYMERPVIEEVWNSVIEFARSVDDSLLFGCHKSMNIVRLKIMIHAPYSLKKITKNSDIYKTLLMIEPYANVVVTSEGQRMIIGSEPSEREEKAGSTPLEQEYLTFDFYFKVILPHRRHRGLKRY